MDGDAALLLICSAVCLFILSNSLESQRGSNNISSTRAKVSLKFLFKVKASMLIELLPVNMLMLDPKASIASSSSRGVLFAVPSIIISVIRLATPIFSGSSSIIPPSILIPKLIKGNSS